MTNDEIIKSNLFFAINGLENARHAMEGLESLIDDGLIKSSSSLSINLLNSIYSVNAIKEILQKELNNIKQ